MKRFISQNWITIFLGIALISSALLAIRNNYVIQRNQEVLEQTQLVKKTTEQILSDIMHGLDLGVRGFALTHDDQLLIPYKKAIGLTSGIFKRIDSLLTIQDYSRRSEAHQVIDEIKQYIELSNKMIAEARADNMPEVISMLKEDRGYQVWSTYSNFSTPLFAFEDSLNQTAVENYQFAVKSNLFLQVAIVILGLPMLYLFVTRVNTERKRRRETLRQVDTADRTYVFDTGVETAFISEQINDRSVSHIRQASQFISSLATGDYAVQWEGLTKQNEPMNNNTLVGNLVRLRDRLQSLRVEDERRNWLNEGVAQFSEIVRSNQHDQDQLSLRSINFLTKYLNAQQGSLFIKEGEGDGQYLKLMGCYAFDRRKWVDKKISIGDGLVGQAYLEGEPMLLTKVPQGYTSITSGLGGTTPSCLSIIPLKHDSNTIAVVEFASFHHILPHQVSFLQKAGEFLASAIVNTRTGARMKQLLEEATMKEAVMREREEELKQNMEELQATQEQLKRNLNEATVM